MRLSVQSLMQALVICFLCMYSPTALADGGKEIVYFECQPNNFLHIRILTLFDITPALDKRTFDLGNLTADQKQHDCRVSKSATVVVDISVSDKHPRNNNVSVLLNGKYLNTLTFEDPGRSYDYFITKITAGGIDIALSETREKQVKATTTHFDENSQNQLQPGHPRE